MATPKFVDQGTYGCVLKPALRCDGKGLNATSVSKIFEANSSGRGLEDAQEEFRFNEYIGKIDPDRIFTLATRGACRINSSKIPPNELRKCDLYSRSMRRREIPQIVMENGGVPLESLLKQSGLTYFRGRSAREIISSMWRLFHGIQVLAKHSVIHQDIKPENILFSYAKVTLIDFGLMTINGGKHYDSVPRSHLRHNYPTFPPEYNLMEVAYRISSVPNYSDIKTNASMSIGTAMNKVLKSKKRIANPRVANLFDDFFSKWTNAYQKVFRSINKEVYSQMYYVQDMRTGCTLKSSGCKFHGVVRSFARHLNQFANKIDVYSLGIVMLYTLVALAETPTIGIHELETVLDRLVFPMINPDPRERYTAEQANNMFNRLYPNAMQVSMSSIDINDDGQDQSSTPSTARSTRDRTARSAKSRSPKNSTPFDTPL